jgi:hypothetical protein
MNVRRYGRQCVHILFFSTTLHGSYIDRDVAEGLNVQDSDEEEGGVVSERLQPAGGSPRPFCASCSTI